MFDILKYVTDMTEKYDSERRLAFRSNNPMGTEAGTIPVEFDELSPQEQDYYQNPPFSTHPDFLGAKGGQVIGKPGGLVEPGVEYYARTKRKVDVKHHSFKSIHSNPKWVKTAEAYFPDLNKKNVNWDTALNYREKSEIIRGEYTLEKAKRFITDDHIKLLKEKLSPEEFKKLDFDSKSGGISNRRRAGWLGVKREPETLALRQKVARVLGLDVPMGRKPGYLFRVEQQEKRIAKIEDAITVARKTKSPFDFDALAMDLVEDSSEVRKKGLLTSKKTAKEFIKNYITDVHGEKEFYKLAPTVRTKLEKTLNKIGNKPKILKWLKDGTILQKKNVAYIANNYFNKDMDEAGRALFHLAEGLEGEKAYMKDLKLPNKKGYQKGIEAIMDAAEKDVFGNPVGNMARYRKERVIAKSIGEGSTFFKSARTNLNKATDEVLRFLGIKNIGTAVDEPGTISVPYKHKGGGYSIYQQQLTRTGKKLKDDFNLAKAKSMDRLLSDIRKALANKTATPEMVEIYNQKVLAVADDINKSVPKGGKLLRPFLIKWGGDPRKTVSGFNKLMKDNPLAAKDMLKTAQEQGWSGVIPKDIKSIYDLRDTKKVKTSILDTIKKGFNEYDEKKLINKIKKLPQNKLFKFFRTIMPRLAQVDDFDTNRFAAANNIMTDATYVDEESPVTEAGMVPEFVTRNPYTSAGVGAAGTTAATLGSKFTKADPLKGLRQGAKKVLKRVGMAALGPTGAAGLWYGLGGVDPKSAADRMGLAAEAVFAPELVKATIGATKGMKNRAAQKVIQQLLNLGLPTQTALRVARVASPLGLLSLGGEGLYHMYKKGHFDKERMIPSLMDKGAYEAAQQEQFDTTTPMFAGGGIATLHPRRPGALPPPSGPDSRGLAYLNNYATKRTE